MPLYKTVKKVSPFRIRMIQMKLGILLRVKFEP